MQRYDEAIEAFNTMLLHLDGACGPDMQGKFHTALVTSLLIPSKALQRQYVSPFEA